MECEYVVGGNTWGLCGFYFNNAQATTRVNGLFQNTSGLKNADYILNLENLVKIYKPQITITNMAVF